MSIKGHAINQIEISVENREAVIKEYAPMIKYVANRIAMRLPPHIELDDLISVGVLGLIDAIDKYDASRGAKFKTYAEFSCLLYTSPSPRDGLLSRMPSSA